VAGAPTGKARHEDEIDLELIARFRGIAKPLKQENLFLVVPEPFSFLLHGECFRFHCCLLSKRQPKGFLVWVAHGDKGPGIYTPPEL
jgi:hypothetical protein